MRGKAMSIIQIIHWCVNISKRCISELNTISNVLCDYNYNLKQIPVKDAANFSKSGIKVISFEAFPHTMRQIKYHARNKSENLFSV